MINSFDKLRRERHKKESNLATSEGKIKHNIKL